MELQTSTLKRINESILKKYEDYVREEKPTALNKLELCKPTLEIWLSNDEDVDNFCQLVNLLKYAFITIIIVHYSNKLSDPARIEAVDYIDYEIGAYYPILDYIEDGVVLALDPFYLPPRTLSF